MTVFFTSSRFQEFCMSYYQLSFGSKCLLKGLMFNQFGQVDIITSSSMLQYHKKSLRLSTSLSFIMLFQQLTASLENLQTPSISPHTPINV